MKKYIPLFVITCLMVFVSCQKAFLDQPYLNGPVSANLFSSPLGASNALTGVYNVLYFEGQTIFARKALGSSAADDIVEDSGDAGRIGAGLMQLDQYNWTGSNTYIMEQWYSSYVGIGRANDVIKYVPSVAGMSDSLKTLYVSQAKTLRAWFYYELVTAFGDVPLITEPISPDQAKSITKNPQQDVWNFIIQDLTDVSSVLPVSWTQTDYGRVTKGFAYGLLSWAYLWTKDYANSIAAANNVTGYSLWPVYADIFNGVAQSSPESIMEVMNSSDSPTYVDIWNEEYTQCNRCILWGPFFSWSYFMQPSRTFINTFFESGDNRLSMVLDLDKGQTYDINGDGVINSLDVIPPNPPVNAFVLKYVPKGKNLTSGSWNVGDLQEVHVFIMRYAEILLNLAEAYNESGQSSSALSPLNLVRARAGLAPITTTSQTELRTIILHERAVEFCFEGYRFFDLKRAGQLTTFLGPLGFITGKNEVFPIPQTEIDLTSIKQNPGY